MGRIATRHYNDANTTTDGINTIKLRENLRRKRYVSERFDYQPAVALLANGYADPTGAGPNSVLGRNGFHATYTGLGVQTILGPVLDVTEGWDISQDQTDNDGVQYVFGALGTFGNHTHVVGTDPPTHIKLKFKIADVSGTDDCLVGFRKNEAVQANVDDYDEMAALNVILGDINVETILNNGATVTTDTTLNWADAETKTLEVRIRGRAAEYFVDGNPATGIPAFNFDTGEVVVPFFFFLQATTSPGKVFWKEIDVGPLSEVNTFGNAA